MEGERKPPTSRNDSLVVGWLGVTSGRPPTSHYDSLGVVGLGVESGRGEETTTSRNDLLVVGWLVVAVVLIVRSYPIKIVVQL